MRSILDDSSFANWPVSSLAYYAQKTAKLFACLSTWYKYVHLFRLTRVRKRKPRYPLGIRAVKPNQIWHADVTIVKTLDNVKAYLYLIVENFSRYIIN